MPLPLLALIPSVLTFVGEAALQWGLWEGLSYGYDKFMGKKVEPGQGTIWAIGAVKFSPIAVYTIHDPSSPAYCILTMTEMRINNRRFYRTFMTSGDEAVILSSFAPDLAASFVALQPKWVRMNFKDTNAIKAFLAQKGLDNSAVWTM